MADEYPGGNYHHGKASSLTRLLPFQAADQGKERHGGLQGSRQALPDPWSNLSGDVFNIRACVNGAMSLQIIFCQSWNNAARVWFVPARKAALPSRVIAARCYA